jgi:hypothetical protein
MNEDERPSHDRAWSSALRETSAIRLITGRVFGLVVCGWFVDPDGLVEGDDFRILSGAESCRSVRSSHHTGAGNDE